MTTLRHQMLYMNPYDIHKLLINDYVLRRSGDTKLLTRDQSTDRTDIDVLRDNHRFLWDDEDTTLHTWEEQFAKKYYNKLFKEYCIGDLSLYKDNKIALRWRTQEEVVVGRGQFTCGNKHCNGGGSGGTMAVNKEASLRTWEVNFAYREQGEKRNALVKIRLCPECSVKLNYRSKKREIKRLDKRTKKQHKKRPVIKKDDADAAQSSNSANNNNIMATTTNDEIKNDQSIPEDSPWDKGVAEAPSKSRDEEMEEYLHDLLF